MSSPAHTSTARLARISIFPIKSLDGVCVPEAELTSGGGLVGDRRWALLDPEGRFVNGKREPGLFRIRARFDESLTRVWLRRTQQTDAEATAFSLLDEGTAVCEWLRAELGRPVALARHDQGGFPDDPGAPGPTVIGASTLAEVANWFGTFDAAASDRRFRSNLIIEGVEPFWEDLLCGPEGTAIRFRVGDVILEGLKPCQRCAVPAHDPDGGGPLAGFQKALSVGRQRTLPHFAERSRFDHFYRLAVCTRLAPGQVGKRLRIGDPVSLLDG